MRLILLVLAASLVLWSCGSEETVYYVEQPQSVTEVVDEQPTDPEQPGEEKPCKKKKPCRSPDHKRCHNHCKD